MNRITKSIVASLLVISSGCSGWMEPASVSDSQPLIFPDYSGVTVPCNIAPMNFMVEGAGHIQAVYSVDGKDVLKVSGRDGILDVGLKEWRALLKDSEGRSVSVSVSVWDDEHTDGVTYSPFSFNVAPDPIDEWVAYRLIEPGYVGWRQLGIYQRNLSDFEESAIVTNRQTSTTCLNCHEFPSYSPESMMFHARGEKGGTVLYDGGTLKMIDFKSIGLKRNTTYPAWHPGGRYIAFSANTTHQIFYNEGAAQVEVFDTASDLTVYDITTGEAITDARFSTPESLETFPAWSPDGKSLYFASHSADTAVTAITPDMCYDLLRVDFDAGTGRFGSDVDTLYNSRISGGSVSHPRVSPDGRYLLYTWSEYGTFPIWHSEADLRMIDIGTGEHIDISVWNDEAQSDSYHSWSSDGRWTIFGSRRLDGRYTRLYIAYLDEDGVAHKPFLLPQKDPRHNSWRLRSYNKPELIKGEVILPKEAENLFNPDK